MTFDTYRVGYQTDIAYKIIKGMVYDLGDIYALSTNVTPVFNDQSGHVSTQTIGIKTGATGLEQIG